jgi:hypothetical protein
MEHASAISRSLAQGALPPPGGARLITDSDGSPQRGVRTNPSLLRTPQFQRENSASENLLLVANQPRDSLDTRAVPGRRGGGRAEADGQAACGARAADGQRRRCGGRGLRRGGSGVESERGRGGAGRGAAAGGRGPGAKGTGRGGADGRRALWGPHRSGRARAGERAARAARSPAISGRTSGHTVETAKPLGHSSCSALSASTSSGRHALIWHFFMPRC